MRLRPRRVEGERGGAGRGPHGDRRRWRRRGRGERRRRGPGSERDRARRDAQTDERGSEDAGHREAGDADIAPEEAAHSPAASSRIPCVATSPAWRRRHGSTVSTVSRGVWTGPKSVQAIITAGTRLRRYVTWSLEPW